MCGLPLDEGILDNSRICQLADCQLADRTYRGLDNSRTGQLADVTGEFACLVFALLLASASPRVVQSVTCPVRELVIRELAYPRVVQLPDEVPVAGMTSTSSPDTSTARRVFLRYEIIIGPVWMNWFTLIDCCAYADCSSKAPRDRLNNWNISHTDLRANSK